MNKQIKRQFFKTLKISTASTWNYSLFKKILLQLMNFLKIFSSNLKQASGKLPPTSFGECAPPNVGPTNRHWSKVFFTLRRTEKEFVSVLCCIFRTLGQYKCLGKCIAGFTSLSSSISSAKSTAQKCLRLFCWWFHWSYFSNIL